MKKNLLSAILVSVSAITFNTALNAQQAFHKHALIVSVSEGSATGNYKTIGTYDNTSATTPGSSYRSSQGNDGEVVHHEIIHGDRDPLIIEYGVSDHWGIGLSSGGDIYKVDPSKFYGFDVETHQVKVKTSDLTFDCNYHFLVTKRWDVSAGGSLGLFGVEFKGKENTDKNPYNYSAGGGIVRGDIRAHYYFYKRLGLFGMASIFSGSCSPGENTKNTVAMNTKTKIQGRAVEFGFCFRFF